MKMVNSGELALPEEKTPPAGAKKIAVVGAGPAGLTAAADLADRGYAVTIYEATSEAGGMLRWGIPAYRLPKDILEYEVELIRRKGIRFVYNTRVGVDITMDKLRQENEAVFLSVGTQSSRKLGVEGEDKTGVDYGLEFLRQAGDKDSLPRLNGIDSRYRRRQCCGRLRPFCFTPRCRCRRDGQPGTALRDAGITRRSQPQH